MQNAMMPTMQREGNMARPTFLAKMAERVLPMALDRPHARDAVSGELRAALSAAVTDARDAPFLWGAIVTATGDTASCVGAGLTEAAGRRTVRSDDE
jgi:enoyl-CoA hydratase/carnithine racemase